MASVKIIGKVGVKVMPDTSDFKQRLKKDLEKIEKSIGDLKVDVIPKLAGEAKVKAAMKKLQQSLDGKNVTIDADLDNGSAAKIEAALAVLTRGRHIDIEVSYDKDRLAGLFENLLMIGGARPQLDGLAKAFDKLKNIDYIAIQTGILATKMVFLAGAALSAASHILTIGGGLVKIAGAGFALPGILGGIAIGLGATIAAFADFNKYVPQAEKYMKQLQNTISKNFWSEAAVPIRKFIDDLFPILNENLATTGTNLGKFFGALATAGKAQLNPALKGMFDALNESIGIFTKHADSIVNIIKVLGETGSSYLPPLAEWVGKILDDFSAFLTKAQNDGSLKKWIDEGITNLQALGSVIGATGSIFKGLYTAAAGGGGTSLTGFADSMQHIADVVNSSGFQTGLADTFRAANEQMSNLVNGAGPGFKKFILSLRDIFIEVAPQMGETMGKALGTLFDALGSQKASDGLLAVFDGVQAAMKNLQPTIKPTVEMFAAFGPVIEALLKNISAFSAQGLDKMAPHIETLAKKFVPLINKAGELALKISGDLTPVFEVMAENAGKVIDALSPLIDSIMKLWNAISPILIPVLKVVVSLLGDALVGVITGVTMVFDGLTKIVQGAIAVFQGIVTVVQGIFNWDFEQVQAGFGQLWDGLLQIVVGAIEAIAGAIWAWLNGSIASIFKGGMLKITSLMDDGWKAIRGKVEEVWNAIKSKLDDFWNQIKGSGGNFVGKIKELFENAWIRIQLKAIELWDAIKGAIADKWESIKSMVQNKVDDVKEKVANAWNAVKEKAGELWENIKGKVAEKFEGIKTMLDNKLGDIKTKCEDAWEAVKTKVGEAWEAVKTKVTEKLGDVVTEVGKLPQKAKDALSGIGSTLVQAGKDLIQGLIDGITSMIGSVKSKLKDLTDILPDWKGPASRDKTLLSNAGVLVIQGFINGLESQYRSVKDSLNGLTKDIAKQFDNGSAYRVGIAADLDTSNVSMSAISGLSRTISTAAAEAGGVQGADGSVHIDNITIPLEDLKQLKTLEEFIDMLRVRTRKGVVA